MTGQMGKFTTDCKTSTDQFCTIIWDYFNAHQRSFAWRTDISPYRVVVSEIMLQQTQTDRVATKFDPFIQAFPDWQALADAPFSQVLGFWKGLGYNRRAQALQKIARLVVDQHGGALPQCIATLETFPSIGPATARSITTFAFNTPTVFIETNIRTVFIYFFFRNQLDIHDKQLLPLIEKTVDMENPRLWYYALMDYGVMLKKNVGNLSRLSAHYNKQSSFQGSDRQIRGKVLALMLEQGPVVFEGIRLHLDVDHQRLGNIVNGLLDDGLIKKTGELFSLD